MVISSTDSEVSSPQQENVGPGVTTLLYPSTAIPLTSSRKDTSSHPLCDSNNNSLVGAVAAARPGKVISAESLADLTNRKKSTARLLMLAIEKADYEELQSLLQSKPDLNVFLDGHTALHYCLRLGRDVSWCKQLVRHGANPNLSTLDGWSTMHLAAMQGHTEILTYLMDCNKGD
jgi:ankyrin repeat protein